MSSSDEEDTPEEMIREDISSLLKKFQAGLPSRETTSDEDQSEELSDSVIYEYDPNKITNATYLRKPYAVAPLEIIEQMYSVINNYDEHRGCSFQKINKYLRCFFKKYGIKDITDVITDLRNYFYIENNRVYKKPDEGKSGFHYRGVLFLKPFEKRIKQKEYLPEELMRSICLVLLHSKRGLTIDELCDRFKERTAEELNPQRYGFTSNDMLINCCMLHYIHKRKVKGKILLYLKERHLKCIGSSTPCRERKKFPSVNTEELGGILEKKLSVHEEEVCGGDESFTRQDLATHVSLCSTDIISVYICDVISPSSFLMQIDTEDSTFQDMVFDLNDFYNQYGDEYQMDDSLIQSEQACTFKHGELGWFRGVILEVKDNGIIKVGTVDYGFIVSTERSCLRILHRDFLKLPMWTIIGSLDGVKIPDGCEKWTSDAVEFFKKLVLDKSLFMLVSKVYCENYIVKGALFFNDGIEVSFVNHLLATAGFAEIDLVYNEGELESDSEE